MVVLLAVRQQGAGMSTIAEQEARVAELRRSRGEEHPDTLAAMLDLAELLWKEGRLAAARPLEEQVVAARLRLFGDSHAAMGNLAAILWQSGERDEAYWLQQQVVETRRRVNGDDDAATRVAVAAFDVMQREAGF